MQKPTETLKSTHKYPANFATTTTPTGQPSLHLRTEADADIANENYQRDLLSILDPEAADDYLDLPGITTTGRHGWTLQDLEKAPPPSMPLLSEMYGMRLRDPATLAIPRNVSPAFACALLGGNAASIARNINEVVDRLFSGQPWERKPLEEAETRERIAGIMRTQTFGPDLNVRAYIHCQHTAPQRAKLRGWVALLFRDSVTGKETRSQRMLQHPPWWLLQPTLRAAKTPITRKIHEVINSLPGKNDSDHWTAYSTAFKSTAMQQLTSQAIARCAYLYTHDGLMLEASGPDFEGTVEEASTQGINDACVAVLRATFNEMVPRTTWMPTDRTLIGLSLLTGIPITCFLEYMIWDMRRRQCRLVRVEPLFQGLDKSLRVLAEDRMGDRNEALITTVERQLERIGGIAVSSNDNNLLDLRTTEARESGL